MKDSKFCYSHVALFFLCRFISDLEPCSQLENNGPHAHITNNRFPYNEEKVET